MTESPDNASRRAALSPEKRALLEARLKGRAPKAPAASSDRIPVRSDSAPAPLSLAQERLWVLHQLEPDSTAYHVPAAFRLKGEVNTAALRQALQRIIARHEVLRTTFATDGERQTQVVAPQIDLEFREIDLRSEPDVAAATRATLAEQATRLFDLGRGPLVRAGLLRTAETAYVLYVMAHHTVSDGWSLGVLLRELTISYEAFVAGKTPELPALAVQYGDFAAWQRDMLAAGESDRQIAYWRNRLAGDLPVLDFPADKPRPAIRSHHGAMTKLTLDRELVAALQRVAQAEQCTLFMVLLAAYNALLHRYTRQDDIIVGTPIANRTRPEVEGLVGFFANTLALRTQIRENASFRELLAEVKTNCLDAYGHQDLPFQKLVEVLAPPRDMSRTPIYQTLFVFMDKSLNETATAGGVDWQRERVEADMAQTDLVLYLEQTEHEISVALEYGTTLFERDTMDRLLANYRVLLRSIASKPELQLAQLELVSPEERALQLNEWNATAVDFDATDTLHGLFEAQVARTPDAPALAFEAETLTYRELNERANRLAHKLIEAGVRPESFVGICLPRSTELIVGLLAILKAGGAYVPLDPSYPEDRLRYMMQDSQARVVVTDAARAPLVTSTGATVVPADAASDASLHAESPRVEVTGDNLAYVIYTSGSTGRPKGVMVMHRNVANFFVGMDDRIPHEKPGTWLAVTSISFDISVLEIFWSLARGFKLVVYSADDRSSAAAQAARFGKRSTHADKHMAFSLFYFASDAGERNEDRYRLLLEGCKFADEHDFVAVWTPERHFHEFGGLYPNPSVAAAAVAVLTRKTQIRAGSCVLPLHDSVRVTEEWSLVDNLSHGRVGIAFATGWQPNDFVLRPDNYRERRAIMFREIETVRDLWRGGTLTRTGGDGKEFTFSTLPRPVQPDLPVWITSGGYNPETFKDAARAGANLLTHLLGQSVDDLARNIAAYREGWREAGHPGQGTVSLMLHTFVGACPIKVKEIVRGPFIEYLRGSIGLFRPFAETMGLDFGTLTPEDLDTLAERAFERYYDVNGLFGTPESCAELVDQLKGVGVDEIACLIDFGIPSETVLEHLPYLDTLRAASVARDNAEAGATEDYSVPGLIRRHAVTHLQCTPSMASMMAADTAEAHALGQLQHWMVGGEAFTGDLATKLSALLPAGRITNMYGPTETTIWSTTQDVDDAGQAVPIGRPIANTNIYILDQALEVVPVGVPGELFIGGAGVVRGYLERPELNAERFPRDPFVGGEARMYKTGDLARYRGDGTLEFLGRNDFQVKLRGYRIELGEIESRLREVESVAEAVVVLREDIAGDKRLVAYLVAEDEASIDVDRAREHLKRGVADYMLPAAYMVLDALPLTPNKKIDRNALPAPDQQTATTSTAFVEPGSEVERLVAEIWRDVLKLDRVGVDDNFFDLGGHSLLIVHVLGQLRARGQSLQMTDLFRFPTIRGLATHLGGGTQTVAKTASAGKDRAAARRARLRRR
ncbi:MAG: LLM class flavin-dependent oxidoreductase [Myxococcales bacterium FL481]|nr:MAG: LLM class flavin-dependent oxidoreductase [Myxococcales bacterium FL481]